MPNIPLKLPYMGKKKKNSLAFKTNTEPIHNLFSKRKKQVLKDLFFLQAEVTNAVSGTSHFLFFLPQMLPPLSLL